MSFPTPGLPTNVSVSVDGLDVYISFTKGTNVYFTTLFYSSEDEFSSIDTHGSSFSFRVYNYNTTYSFYFESVSDEGISSGYSGTYSFTTGSVKPATPSPPSLISRGEGSLYFNWNPVPDAMYYTVMYSDGTNYQNVYNITRTNHTLIGLTFGKSYNVYIMAHNGTANSGWSQPTTMRTLPQTPSISLGTVTPTSVQINIGNLSPNFHDVRVYLCENTLEEKEIGQLDGLPNSSVTFNNLPVGVQYKFKARSRITIGGELLYSYAYSNVISNKLRPENWEWSYDIRSGGEVYRTMYKDEKIIAYIMTALEWRSFCERINQFLIYKNKSTIDFSYVSSDDNVYPYIINEAIGVINDLGFNIPLVTSETIPASVFIQMRNCLNSIQ